MLKHCAANRKERMPKHVEQLALKKLKFPSKNMRENQQIRQLFIQFINHVW
jgi:hypothetical protein